jgi:hypothetical protein
VASPPAAATTTTSTTTTTTTLPAAWCQVDFPPSVQTDPVTGEVGTYSVAFQGWCAEAYQYAAAVPGSVVTVVTP